MADRSASVSVRNPLWDLPSARALRELPAEQRNMMARLLMDIAVEANAKAEASWKKRKGPMAAYWRAVCTYAKHAARAIRGGAWRHDV